MAVEIITSFGQQCDASGDPMSGAKIYVYDVGTTTPKTLYPNSDLTGTADNPIVCDSAGRHDMRYVATGSYKIVVKTSADVTVFTRDNIDGRVPVGSGALAIANGGTGATSAPVALSNLGGATAAELADVAADVAALSGSLSSTEKTHIATGTTAQRPASPIEGDIRRNTTTGEWEAYNGSSWEELAIQTEVTTEIAAAIGWTLLATGTASASATIDFTALSDTYESYLIDLASVKPATDDVSLNIRIGTGGGPTYQTSGYRYTTAGAADNASGVSTNQSSSAAAIITTGAGGGAGIGNASGEHVRGSAMFGNPEGSDFCLFDWNLTYVRADANGEQIRGSGFYGTVGAITGVRFMMSSGNIASGTFRLYGWRKS